MLREAFSCRPRIAYSHGSVTAHQTDSLRVVERTRDAVFVLQTFTQLRRVKNTNEQLELQQAPTTHFASELASQTGPQQRDASAKGLYENGQRSSNMHRSEPSS